MEITFFSLPHLGLGLKIQFFRDIISVINKNDADLLKVKNQMIALTNRYQELSLLYMTDAKNPLNQQISTLDVKRDECLLSLWLMVEGYAHSPFAANKRAGEKLLRNISLYADSPSIFIRQEYHGESANISGLLKRWNTQPELKNAVEALNLSALTTALGELNSQHNMTSLERNGMYATETTDTSKQKQKETSAAYYDLCKALNSLAFVTPSPLYDKIIREINALIDSVDLPLKQKAGRRKEKAPEKA